jgi:hypothetical protein
MLGINPEFTGGITVDRQNLKGLGVEGENFAWGGVEDVPD